MIFSSSSILSKLPKYDALLSLTELTAKENAKLYLVGGTIRNIILERPIDDLDFTVSVDAIDFAKKFGEIIGVKVIILDEEQKTARLIFRNGELYMDFSSIRGENIIEDLMARDLTINAMAVDFSKLMTSDTVELLDPHNGIGDLNNKLIKIPSQQTILDDPLRMLRAFRFASTLNFTIQDETKNLIHKYSELLKSSSVERIRDELYKILESDDSFNCLKAMDRVNLLEQIFPEIIPMKDMVQNEYHHLDVWEHSLLALDFFERETIPDSLFSHLLEIEKYLNFEIVKGRTRRSLLKLAVLLHDVGKPSVRMIDKNGRIRFFDHHNKGAEIALNIGTRLKLANRETLSMSKVIEYHMAPLLLLCSQKKHILQEDRTKNILQFIQKTNSECLSTILVAFADLQATQGVWRRDDDLVNMSMLISDIADAYFDELNSPMGQLIKGDELMRVFGLSQGPEIGKILSMLKEAQINGIIKDRREALNLVRRTLDKSDKLIK